MGGGVVNEKRGGLNSAIVPQLNLPIPPSSHPPVSPSPHLPIPSLGIESQMIRDRALVEGDLVLGGGIEQFGAGGSGDCQGD
jgi:hypothetical protein